MHQLSRQAFLQSAVAVAAGAAGGLTPALAAWAADQTLRVTALEPYVLQGGRCFVLVRTDAGITGLGEASPMNSVAAAKLIETAFAPLLKDMNPLDIERCWEKLYYRTYKQGVMGLQPEALAAIDIALWDILGKVTEMPLHQLLGGKRRDSVRVYASIGGGAHATPAEMAKRAEQAAVEGFTAVKVRMDYGPVTPDADVEKDLEMLREVRKAIGPEVELKYDVNNGYSVPTAIRVGKMIEELGVVHYEEPVAQTDYAGYAQVVEAVDVPVAAGEHEYTRWQFRDLIDQAHVDILQPDLVKCAGISEAVKIATLASTHHKLLCPHQTQPTIGTAANLHFTSVFVQNDMAQELAENALKSPLHEMFTTRFEFSGGRLTVPNGPGLGLELGRAYPRGCFRSMATPAARPISPIRPIRPITPRSPLDILS
ncbi:MAG: mandelate racemase/muconate lactonizing enzyme family protein [Candidatus Hydrogenedentes bacterium]|nr:mandelate racemase/muconate lactonizing enzyme family protein [Candidatus Hydrogenedentota bacterium]